jgi:hypothetical protein
VLAAAGHQTYHNVPFCLIDHLQEAPMLILFDLNGRDFQQKLNWRRV